MVLSYRDYSDMVVHIDMVEGNVNYPIHYAVANLYTRLSLSPSINQLTFLCPGGERPNSLAVISSTHGYLTQSMPFST